MSVSKNINNQHEVYRCPASCCTGIFVLAFTAVLFFMGTRVATAGQQADDSHWQQMRTQAVSLAGQGEKNMISGDLYEAYCDYKKAYGLFENIATDYPDKPKSKNDISAINDRFGDLFIRMGSKDKALGCYLKSLKVVESVSDTNKAVDKAANLAISYLKLGDTYTVMGMFDDAASSYRQLLAFLQDQPETDKPALKNIYNPIINFRMSRMYALMGNRVKAEEAEKKGSAERENYAKRFSDKGFYLYSLVGTYCNLAEQYSHVGLVAEAVATYIQALDIGQRLVEKYPDNNDYLRKLAAINTALGDLFYQVHEPDKALAVCTYELKNYKKLAELNGSDKNDLLNISVSYYRLGSIYSVLKKNDDSLAAYENSLEIRSKLLDADKNNEKLIWGVSDCLEALGALYAQTGKSAKALKEYHKVLDVLRPLLNGNSSIKAQRDVMVTYSKMGDVLKLGGEISKAMTNYKKALNIAEMRVKNNPLDGSARVDLAQIKKQLNGF